MPWRGRQARRSRAWPCRSVAARELGAAGLATFSVVYGAMVLATAVCSGLVGDSLTVLDRHRPDIRAGLHVGAVAVSAVAGLLGGVAGARHGPGAGLGAPLLGLATRGLHPRGHPAAAAHGHRPVLVAAGRGRQRPASWRLGVLAVAAASGPLTLSSFVLAVLAGQTGAAVVAWALLPAVERPRGPWRRPALAEVAAFGTWRALAQTIRPAMLTLLRLLVIGGGGAAAYGPLEVARVYTAPTLVLVAGMGSFLLPHFVALRPQGAAAGLRSADRAALGLTLGVAGICVVALAGLPWLGPLLTGGGYAVPVAAVAGWSRVRGSQRDPAAVLLAGVRARPAAPGAPAPVAGVRLAAGASWCCSWRGATAARPGPRWRWRSARC